MIANKAAFTAALDQLHIMPLDEACITRRSDSATVDRRRELER